MLSKYLKQDIVKTLFKKITTDEKFIHKDIPNRINEEKINQKEYALYVFLDAIIKYAILVDDIDLFDKFLDQLERILRKVEVHNEIKSGVTKLLIKNVANKLSINNIENKENKKEIIQYFYHKYIVNGYYYYPFPSIYLNQIQQNGIMIEQASNLGQQLEKINKILIKYNINDVFSRGVNQEQNPQITDSFFMACFYATNCPLYLQEICINLTRGTNPNKKFNKEAYFSKDYNECIHNIEFILKKKGVSIKERQIIKAYFEQEWNRLSISDAYPVIALIKRKDLEDNYLYDIQTILSESNHVDLYTSISKILEPHHNQKELKHHIKPSEIEQIPNIKDYLNQESKEEKLQSSSLNETGNATIVALVGVLLITLGVVGMLIMLGRR